MANSRANIIKWEINERPPHKHASEYNLTVIAITVGAEVLAVIFEAYSFMLLILLAGAMTIYLTKIPNRKFFFELTNRGLATDNEFYNLDDMVSYNIFDDPNERAHLLLKVKRVEGFFSVPIFDVDIEKVETYFQTHKINREATLSPTFIDRLLEFI